jgi:fructuronate reductase
MVNEQAPTLSVQGVDLCDYAQKLIERYSNPALQHRTWQIAMNGSQKLPQRMLDSVRWHLRHGSSFSLLASGGVTGWMKYVSGQDDAGEPIELSDPLASDIKRVVNASPSGAERAAALQGLQSIFGDDLPQNPVFVSAVTDACLSL